MNDLFRNTTNLAYTGLDTFESDDNSEVPPSDIVAFNELRSCADIYRLNKRGLLDLKPDFQRDFVWSTLDQSRFIDSLIKGLPIPSMCFAHDWKKDQYQVIDGLQRISTIARFLDGDPKWKLSKEEDIDPKIAGKRVSDIRDGASSIRKYFDRVENISIPITILRCDMSKSTHSEYVFTIFHRLNTGGTKLNNQEIRNCIFSGPFNDALADFDQYANWRSLNQMDDGKNYRFTKQEIILRLFAFLENRLKYKGRLSKFLNDYMRTNRYASAEKIDDMRNIFEWTSDAIYEGIFNREAPKSINVSVFESVLVGVANNIEYWEHSGFGDIKSRYDMLLKSEPFSPERLKEGLSGKPRVDERMQTAIGAFGPDGI
ncbi:MAG: DUF262 domain-containing protein [Pseudomonadota bacterium]